LFVPLSPTGPKENLPGGEMTVFDKPRPGPVEKIRYVFISPRKGTDKEYKVTIKAFICEHPSK
jgi:hypothetical protein